MVHSYLGESRWHSSAEEQRLSSLFVRQKPDDTQDVWLETHLQPRKQRTNLVNESFVKRSMSESEHRNR